MTDHQEEECQPMSDSTLQMIFAVAALVMVYGSPFVAFWDFGAAVLFLIVGVGTLVGLTLQE